MHVSSHTSASRNAGGAAAGDNVAYGAILFSVSVYDTYGGKSICTATEDEVYGQLAYQVR